MGGPVVCPPNKHRISLLKGDVHKGRTRFLHLVLGRFTEYIDSKKCVVKEWRDTVASGAHLAQAVRNAQGAIEAEAVVQILLPYTSYIAGEIGAPCATMGEMQRYFTELRDSYIQSLLSDAPECMSTNRFERVTSMCQYTAKQEVARFLVGFCEEWDTAIRVDPPLLNSWPVITNTTRT